MGFDASDGGDGHHDSHQAHIDLESNLLNGSTSISENSCLCNAYRHVRRFQHSFASLTNCQVQGSGLRDQLEGQCPCERSVMHEESNPSG